MNINKKRNLWNSKIGFILSTAGASVGIGNILRFPYLTIENGGAAFVFIYIICVILLGIPMMLAEFSLGRSSHYGPVKAINAIKKNSAWRFVGILGIATSFFILSYYIVMSGWIVNMGVKMFNNQIPVVTDIMSAPKSIIWIALFFISVVYVVNKGLIKGIEKSSKIIMPILLLVIILLAVRSSMLENASIGIKAYLFPDFSKVDAKTFLNAMSQAFFSLCVGEAVLITYGSYASKKENLFSSSVYTSIFDTLVAVLSGLIIFPAFYSLGGPDQYDSSLILHVMPKVFSTLPMSSLFGVLFFLLLALSAFTTSVALLQIPVSYISDTFKIKKNVSVIIVSISAFLISIPIALSKGIVDILSTVSLYGRKGLYEIMDFIWGNIAMSITGLLIAIFVGWIWGRKNFIEEIKKGSNLSKLQLNIISFLVKYIAPITIVFIISGIIF